MSSRIDRRVPELDGVRGVAILLVLIFHYVAIPSSGYVPGYVTQLLSLTWSGVDLFFVLSGFLLGGILMDHRDARNYFSVFYVRRACRILPLYYLVLAAYGVLVVSTLPAHLATSAWLFADPLPLWSHVVFLQNFFAPGAAGFGPNWLSITWSLAVEEQFYLLLPVVIRTVQRGAVPFIAAAAIVGAPIFRLVLGKWLGGLAGGCLLPCRADALMGGVLVASIARSPAALSYLQQHRRALSVTFLGLLAGAGALSVSPGVFGVANYSWLAMFYSVGLLLVLISWDRPMAQVLRWRVLQVFGLLSYALYMLHQAVNGLLQGLVLHHETPQLGNAQDVIVTAGSLLCLVGIALVSYAIVERPALRFGHAFTYSDQRLA